MASSRNTSNGPDATDVATLLAAIQSLHQVDVSLTIQPAGEYGEGGLAVIALATRRGAVDGVVLRSVSRKRHYPSRDAATFEGLLFRLGHELDRDCGEMWHQQSFTAE